MKYLYSHLDDKNLDWFSKDDSVQSLVGINIEYGNLRGLFKTSIDFNYPISAIAGINGSGKSTLLAIAACAYHNRRNGFIPDDRVLPYYTFKDFFLQTCDEIPPEGIQIWYCIRHNSWWNREPGPAHQNRKKSKGGRWNDYSLRVHRNVVYFGTLRVVPPNELKTYKSYSRHFAITESDKELSLRICTIVSKVIGKCYTCYQEYKHKKFTIPVVEVNGVKYSGFNMGAGEKAVFSIINTILRVGRGCLLVIDEIELGLHSEAQVRLVSELKLLCKEFHCQVICSTHSAVILESIPPEGRIYIERQGDKTNIIRGISSEFASGKMSGSSSRELTIFVEDTFAKMIIENSITFYIRNRIELFVIGSDESIVAQVISRCKEDRMNFLAVLDGDKRTSYQSQINKIIKSIGGNIDDCSELSDKIAVRLAYLPGDKWPENELLHELSSDHQYWSELAKIWDTPIEILTSSIDAALLENKHNEFYKLARCVSLDKDAVIRDVTRVINSINKDYFADIQQNILDLLI